MIGVALETFWTFPEAEGFAIAAPRRHVNVFRSSLVHGGRR